MIWLLLEGRHSGRDGGGHCDLRGWVSKLAERYARHGADWLGDLRRGNPGGARPLLSADDLEALRERLRRPPNEGASGAGRRLRIESRPVLGLSMCMRRAAGRLEEVALVGPSAAAEKPEGGERRRGGGF